MTELYATFTLLLAEVNLLFLLAGGIVAAIFLRRRQRDSVALARLVSRLKNGRPTRLEAHRQFLAAQGISEAERETTAQALIQAEDRFFRTVINTYAQRDSAAAGQLDQIYTAAVAPYRVLSGSGVQDRNGDERAEELERLRSRIEELEAENQRLEAAGETQASGAEKPISEAAGEPAEETVVEDVTEEATREDEASDSDTGLEDLNLDDIDLGLDDDVRQTG